MKTVSEHLTEEDLKTIQQVAWEKWWDEDPNMTHEEYLTAFAYEKGFHAGVCSENQAVS